MCKERSNMSDQKRMTEEIESKKQWVRKQYSPHMQHCSLLRNCILSLLLLLCTFFHLWLSLMILTFFWFCPIVLGKYFFLSIWEGAQHMWGYWHYANTLNEYVQLYLSKNTIRPEICWISSHLEQSVNVLHVYFFRPETVTCKLQIS